MSGTGRCRTSRRRAGNLPSSLAIAKQEAADAIRQNSPRTIVANVSSAGRNGSDNAILYDATGDPAFATLMLEYDRAQAPSSRKRGTAGGGDVINASGEILANGHPEPRMLAVEQSNSSIAFGDKYILKFFRLAGNRH